jgi:hypothetical protein
MSMTERESFLRDHMMESYRFTEKDITDFCGACDRFVLNELCTLATNNVDLDQFKYVNRRWCGWAAVKGARGEMTEKGFKPFGR